MKEQDCWTPKLVAERLIEAVSWVRYSGGPVGPTDRIRSALPHYAPSLEDHLEEGWGIPEIAGDEMAEDRAVRLPPSPEKITAHMDALQWQSRYLADGNNGAGRMLSLWLACRVHGASFERAVDRRGTMNRRAAYRLKDRALSLIAQGLQRDEVAL